LQNQEANSWSLFTSQGESSIVGASDHSIFVLQSAQHPDYRHHTYDPVARSTAAVQRSEGERKAAAAEVDDMFMLAMPILESSVKQTAMVASMIAAFTDESAAIAESLQCAPLMTHCVMMQCAIEEHMHF
jgi:hypothetical protein